LTKLSWLYVLLVLHYRHEYQAQTILDTTILLLAARRTFSISHNAPIANDSLSRILLHSNCGEIVRVAIALAHSSHIIRKVGIELAEGQLGLRTLHRQQLATTSTL
jgi:hypothetical protein